MILVLSFFYQAQTKFCNYSTEDLRFKELNKTLDTFFGYIILCNTLFTDTFL